MKHPATILALGLGLPWLAACQSATPAAADDAPPVAAASAETSALRQVTLAVDGMS